MSTDPKTIDLAEKAFKTVLDADIHQDNKAGRILAAMAFLTAASASIFSKVYSFTISNSEIQRKLTEGLSPVLGEANQSIINDLALSLQTPRATVFGIDWALFSFLVYMICVLVGASFYLAALGPSFNVPTQIRHAEGGAVPRSLIFFRSIEKVSSTQWTDYWKSKTPAELQTELEKNFIYETHLIAEKTQQKVDFMSLGNVLFKMAFIFLACLISSVFSHNLNSIRLVIVLSTFLLTGALGIEGFLHSSHEEKRRNLILMIPIWIVIILLLSSIKLA